MENSTFTTDVPSCKLPFIGYDPAICRGFSMVSYSYELLSRHKPMNAKCKSSLSALGPQNYMHSQSANVMHLNILLGYPLCLTTTHNPIDFPKETIGKTPVAPRFRKSLDLAHGPALSAVGVDILSGKSLCLGGRKWWFNWQKSATMVIQLAE